MAKLKPKEKRVQLSFQRPEDLRLFSFMEKRRLSSAGGNFPRSSSPA